MNSEQKIMNDKVTATEQPINRTTDSLMEELASAESQRDEAFSHLTEAENRLSLERMLYASGVIDVETAELLVSKKLKLNQSIDGEQLRQCIEQLLLDKPFLRQSFSLPPGTAAAKSHRAAKASQLADAAARAVRSGSRRDIAEYLRLRRRTATN